MDNIPQLKTPFLYKAIERSSSRDKTFNIGNYNVTINEILFWKYNNNVKYNNKIINCYNISLLHVHSDASNTEIACVFDAKGKENIYRNLSHLGKTFGSTWPKLEATNFLFSLQLSK